MSDQCQGGRGLPGCKWARANQPNPPNCLWLFLRRNKKDLSSPLTLEEDLMICCVCVSLPFLFVQEQQNASQIRAWKYAALEALCSLGCRWFVHVRLIAAFWFITPCADVLKKRQVCFSGRFFGWNLIGNNCRCNSMICLLTVLTICNCPPQLFPTNLRAGEQHFWLCPTIRNQPF